MPPCGLGREREIKAGRLSEGVEVAIASDQGKAGVQTKLGDERIGEASSAPLGENLCAECSGSLPKTGLDLYEREIRETGSQGRGQAWVAQKFGEHDREHQQLMALKGLFQQEDVVT